MSRKPNLESIRALQGFVISKSNRYPFDVIEIHGAPFDLGGARQGSRLGPDALRLAGLAHTLFQDLDLQGEDRGDITVDLSAEPGSGLPYARAVSQGLVKLKKITAEVLARGNFPIMLGGEHSMSAGPLSAMVDHYGDELGILWIDAHADINTPDLSETQNIHGMPLALLCGLESGVSGELDKDWRLLQDSVVQKRLNPANIAWFGLRDVDDGERSRARQGCAVTMHDIDRDGVLGSWQRIHNYFVSRGCKSLYVSLDVDAMDPILAPGTGTAVRGGLSYREAHFLAELIYSSLSTSGAPYRLVGLDVVEVSPIHDSNNQTAIVATEWVASLFGKSIL
jgi:arginase